DHRTCAAADRPARRELRDFPKGGCPPLSPLSVVGQGGDAPRSGDEGPQPIEVDPGASMGHVVHTGTEGSSRAHRESPALVMPGTRGDNPPCTPWPSPSSRRRGCASERPWLMASRNS